MVALVLLGACTTPEVHDTLPLAERLAGDAVARWPGEAQAFDWIPTVLGFGMHRLYAATGDDRWQGWYRAWLETAPESPVFHSSDSLSPAVLASTLILEDPGADLVRVTDAADAYLATAPRTASGAIEHWADGSALGELGQVWVDSMFMVGLYLIREQERIGAPALDFAAQYALFSELCRDPADDLYRHAWDDVAGQNIPVEPVYWARGNAWVLVAGAEWLAIAPDDPIVGPLFDAHLDAVLAAQQEDGLWRTVLVGPDDPANYAETSASALFGYAIARAWEAGVADDDVLPALDRAVTAVRGRIDDGVVEGTSFGTNPSTYEEYVAVPVADDLMLGVGAVVAFLAEADGVERP